MDKCPNNDTAYMESTLEPSLIRAYRETEYRVDGTPPLVLRIGESNPKLARLMLTHALECCAFITACNPHSQLMDPATNERLQQSLAVTLQERAIPFLEGYGIHPDNDWPGEPSFLILGLSREAASKLGIRYRQNAIVWADLTAIPELILLR